ncbi:hypothetical protein J8273_2271 [Carpediemonas membranifera]|uniref:Uncharacterized protein n=1 Tax=Carpediemonas membranifera TaxID=201153 RepID=A0A8J6BER4_9EUKA|nr:hypothetical protein J8273_2271 [Carpediemonas membranifera]|eukprot:KAG9395922.1 hypothetical protein J8273_2271 [Carpediemonas membranifera]
MNNPTQIISVEKSHDERTTLLFTDGGAEVFHDILASNTPVISFIGAKGTRKSQLANAIMGTVFPLFPHEGGTKGVWVQQSHGATVLDFQGSYDGGNDARNADHQAGLASFVLSDACVLCMHSTSFETDYGEELLEQLFSNLRKFSRVDGRARAKMRLHVVLHDYDRGHAPNPSLVTRTDIELLKRRYQDIWTRGLEADEGRATLGDWVVIEFHGIGPDPNAQLNPYHQLKNRLGSAQAGGYSHCQAHTAHEVFRDEKPQSLLGRFNEYDLRYILDKPVATNAMEAYIKWFRERLCHSTTDLANDAEATRAEAVKLFDDDTKGINATLRAEFREKLKTKVTTIAIELNKTLLDQAPKLGKTIMGKNAVKKWGSYIYRPENESDEKKAVRKATLNKALAELFKQFCDRCTIPSTVDRDAVRAHLRLSHALPEQVELANMIAQKIFNRTFKCTSNGNPTVLSISYQLKHMITNKRLQAIIVQATADTKAVLKAFEAHILAEGTSETFMPDKVPEVAESIENIRRLTNFLWNVLSWIGRKALAALCLVSQKTRAIRNKFEEILHLN